MDPPPPHYSIVMRYWQGINELFILSDPLQRLSFLCQVSLTAHKYFEAQLSYMHHHENIASGTSKLIKDSSILTRVILAYTTMYNFV